MQNLCKDINSATESTKGKHKMFCPKCGTKNPDDVRSCQSCSWDLTNVSSSVQIPDTRIYTLAILSLVLSVLSIVLFILLARIGIPWRIRGIILVSQLMAITGLVLGIIAMAKVKENTGALKGRNLAIVGIVVAAVWVSLLFVYNLLTPVKRFPPSLKQKAQLHSIDAALELFASELDAYPPSDAMDKDKKPYCGAMKLCEAIMGQDLMGFHPDSHFRRDGTNDYNNPIYGPATLQARKGPFLPIGMSNAYQLKDIYKDVGSFDGNSYVICDVFAKMRPSGKRIGMPILYYKADTSKTNHDLENPDDPNNIYNYKDNYALLELGVPEEQDKKHPLFTDPKIFYKMTKNYMITTQSRPCRADSYVLISAGLDGLYGTKDDIGNFEMGWKPGQKGKNK